MTQIDYRQTASRFFATNATTARRRRSDNFSRSTDRSHTVTIAFQASQMDSHCSSFSRRKAAGHCHSQMLLTQKTVVPHIPRPVYFRLAPISTPTTTAIVLIRFTQPRCSVWPGPPGGPYPINTIVSMFVMCDVHLLRPPNLTQPSRKPLVPSPGDRKSTRLNSSHSGESRMPSSA